MPLKHDGLSLSFGVRNKDRSGYIALGALEGVAICDGLVLRRQTELTLGVFGGGELFDAHGMQPS